MTITIKQTMRDNFAVFILSNGRANNVITLNTILNQGYTGKWYIVVDDEDSQLSLYKELYKNNVLIFNKNSIAKEFDLADNFNNKKVIVYARNVCFKFAEELGLDYFLELDDDYVEFELRTEERGKLLTTHLRCLDYVFELMIDFLEDTKSLTVAFAQGGDMIGGCEGGTWKKKLKRKAMNSFFCKTSNKFNFVGRINEDVNTYVSLGSKGNLFLTIALIDLRQVPTQNNEGGMTNIYNNLGTYVKSFYTIMMNPSCTKISLMGESHKRIHHIVEWDLAVPKIISSKFKKNISG